MPRLIIFAGNYEQACAYAHEVGRTRTGDFIFVGDRWRIAGLERSQSDVVATVGTWRGNPDVLDAYQYFLTRPEHRARGEATDA